MINLSDIVNDPDFAQSFVITRSQGGSFVDSVWQDASITVNAYGVIQPATDEDLDQVPEGDRVKGAMMFHCSQPIYQTRVTSGNGALSDTIAWNGQTWRIVHDGIWMDFGYYKAIGVRLSGE